MQNTKEKIESLNFKIMCLRYEAQSVQFPMSQRMKKKRQIRQLEKERDGWKTQNVS